MSEISATDLAREAGKYVKLAEAGESFDISRHGEVVARLSPATVVPQVSRPVPWQRSPSAGTAGSPVAADGRRHGRDFPCPPGKPYKLSEDRRMWLEDWPPLNLKTVDRVLAAAFPAKKRY